MDQPPRPTPGNLPLDDTQRSTGQGRTVPGGFTDPSTFETMPASAATAANSTLSSATLAVLGRRYDILGEAGRGAMGQVYKARDRETGEIVALKLLKPEISSDPGMVERFKSELLFARRITHKNVCRVYEFNRVDGIAYTSMEFVEGESLRSVLKRFGSLTSRKAIDLALQMCDGLKEAHAQGIVHRDLKPENVMIDAQGNVKVMDFGIARSMESLTLLTGSMVGTPAYMAPEQAAGKTVDYRADIYALGLMLYEMFTGTQPFHADNAVALAVKHMQESPRPPREMEPSISGSIDSAILKCLEKAPESRFQSISELEATLRSQLPADRSATLYPASTSNATVGAVVTTAVPVSSAAPARITRRAGPIAAILVVSVVALGAGIVWRGRAPRQAAQEAVPVSEDSSSPVPNISIAATPNPLSITTNAPAKPATPAASKPRKVATSPHADASVASSDAGHSAPPVSTPVAPIASQSGLALAGTTPPDTAAGSSQNTAPPPGDSDAPAAKGGNGYVWVNRFPREVGAQNAAKRIEEMGLPVTIIPRHNVANDNDFFVVLTGPYPAARIDGIVEQLKAKGFALARLNRAGAAATNPVPRTRPAPAP